jgi:hypothetical protein
MTRKKKNSDPIPRRPPFAPTPFTVFRRRRCPGLSTFRTTQLAERHSDGIFAGIRLRPVRQVLPGNALDQGYGEFGRIMEFRFA